MVFLCKTKDLLSNNWFYFEETNYSLVNLWFFIAKLKIYWGKPIIWTSSQDRQDYPRIVFLGFLGLNEFLEESKQNCSRATIANFVLNSESIPIGNQRKLPRSSHGWFCIEFLINSYWKADTIVQASHGHFRIEFWMNSY